MIPKIIHQTVADKKDIHPVFLENIENLKRLNPGWEHRLYDNSEYRDFIDDPELRRAYDKINPAYGVAYANLFRCLIMHKVGGVYLDIKSRVINPLDTVLLPDDVYFLSHWDDKKYPGWGKHPELKADGEYQQWYLVSAPGHPFSLAALARFIKNINAYDPIRDGVGKDGELRNTGPIAYTLAIYEVQDKHPYRLVDSEALGFQYTMFTGWRDHESYTKRHYSTLTEPIIFQD